MATRHLTRNWIAFAIARERNNSHTFVAFGPRAHSRVTDKMADSRLEFYEMGPVEWWKRLDVDDALAMLMELLRAGSILDHEASSPSAK